jgi:hypothetical protein
MAPWQRPLGDARRGESARPYRDAVEVGLAGFRARDVHPPHSVSELGVRCSCRCTQLRIRGARVHSLEKLGAEERVVRLHRGVERCAQSHRARKSVVGVSKRRGGGGEIPSGECCGPAVVRLSRKGTRVCAPRRGADEKGDPEPKCQQSGPVHTHLSVEEQASMLPDRDPSVPPSWDAPPSSGGVVQLQQPMRHREKRTRRLMGEPLQRFRDLARPSRSYRSTRGTSDRERSPSGGPRSRYGESLLWRRACSRVPRA